MIFMKIIILGAGVAGSVLADLLTERGHQAIILEKERRPGGMCKSYYKQGFVYEYGPHILATHNSSQKAADYIKSKISTVETQLTTASNFDGKNTYYPPSLHSAEVLGFGEQVRKELAQLPPKPDETNFKTYLISKVGPTLYKLFFDSFTRKFWGIEPDRLSAEWAKTRRLGESLDSKKMFFNDRWCAYPKRDWNELFENLLRQIPVVYDTDVASIDFKTKEAVTSTGDRIEFDFIVSTMHIDELFDYRLGKLQYAGYRIDPVILDKPHFNQFDDQAISMTYYPQENIPYCRVTDYRTFQKKKRYPYDRRTVVTYEYPDHTIRLYPFTDCKNLALFESYLREASRYPFLLSFGRMGLYKYLTSDTTVEMAFRALDRFDAWGSLDQEHRLNAYKSIRGDWSN